MSDKSGLIGVISSHARHATITGIVMAVCGVLAIAAPAVAGVSAMIVLGVMLLVGGLSQCFLAFKAGAFGRGLLIFVLGALAVIAGVWTLGQPLSALSGITLLLAAYFIVSGVIEAFGAFSARPANGWGWLFFSGIVSLALGVMLWKQFPLSGLWAVGTLIGIRLLMAGISLIAIGSIVGKGVKVVSARR
jgi:uncharacterized membrane protein HdeD (DUF308 family)